jgi:hypothetical protein
MPDLQIMAGIKDCPASPFGLPYVSVVLGGVAADELAMPCTVGLEDTCSKASGMVCEDLSVVKPLGIDIFNIGMAPSARTPDLMGGGFFDIMKKLGLYDDNDASPGCYNMSTLVAGWPSVETKHNSIAHKSSFFCSPIPFLPTIL